MKQRALTKAAEHLELAKLAVEKLDLGDGPKAYRIAWSEFLSQASRLYNTLEQGAKGCKVSEPWFGRKRHERRKDPLLSYIHHARDSDEHGLDYVVAKTFSSADIHMAEGAPSFDINARVMIERSGKVHVQDFEVSNPEAIKSVKFKDVRMELVTAKDSRFGDSFDPPQMHQDKPIAFNSPPTVANLALAYLEEMLEEASQLPEHL